MKGGRFRRLDVGEVVRRAQSRGEWLGGRSTFLLGLRGMVVWVGGGARECEAADRVELRFGRGLGERLGSGPRGCEDAVREDGDERVGGRGAALAPPDVRWAEFMAGKEGISGSGSGEVEEVVVDVDAPSREKEGIWKAEDAALEGFARGVVGEEGRGGCDAVGFLMKGGGGGGMAARSSAALLGGAGDGSMLLPSIIVFLGLVSCAGSVIWKGGA